VRDDYEAKQKQLNHFSGALAAFRYTGDLTQEEQNAWHRKMMVALGYELPDLPPPGRNVAQVVYVGDPEKRPKSPPAESAPLFVRSHPGPDQEFEVYGGRLQIVAIEVYDTAVAVRWRVSPEPDISLAFPDETRQLEQDMEGLEGWAAEELRRKAEHRLRAMRLYQFLLTDDFGTEYVQRGSRSGGGSGVRSGEAEFQPPPPPAASELVLKWLGLEVSLPLS
jgi:hypothetical protein